VLKYILKRVLLLIPIALGVTLIVFLLMHITPGDPVALMLGQRATPETIIKVRHELGLDKPAYVQYFLWLLNIFKGNLGNSITTGYPVLEMIKERIPATLELTIISLVLSSIVSIFLGSLSALHRGKLPDQLSRVFSLFGISMPYFWFGLVLLMIFSFRLGWLPIYGRGSGAWWSLDRLKHLVLPVIVLSLANVALLTRLTRSTMLDVLGEDYIKTAKGKGLPKNIIIYKHALRNALIPVVTILGLRIAYTFGGAVVTETVFAWPGMGRLIIEAIYQRDIPVVQGITLTFAMLVMLTNLLVDIIYTYIDPRISIEK
jgi:peptide/nickel transport system permease protein